MLHKLKAVQNLLLTVEKTMREAQAKADAIDAAVYDCEGGEPLCAHGARHAVRTADTGFDCCAWLHR